MRTIKYAALVAAAVLLAACELPATDAETCEVGNQGAADTGAPPMPTGLIVTDAEGLVRAVAWQPSEGASHYEVEVQEDDERNGRGWTTIAIYNVTEPMAETPGNRGVVSYAHFAVRWRVRAWNAAGSSRWSPFVCDGG